MDLATVVRRQHGVLARGQARACGISDASIGRRVASGTWWPVFAGVYVVTDRVFTDAARAWSVLLWAGPGATLIGAAAGWWWGLVDELPRVIAVAVPPERRPRPPEWVRVDRRRLASRDRVHRRGLPVVDLATAVLETAVELGDEAGARVMDRALQRRVSLDDLRRARSRMAGRRGACEMGRLITLAGDRARSALERLVVRLLTDAGLCDWEVNAKVALAGRSAEIDILFREAMVAVELKGWAFHSDPASVDADHDRENALQIAGFLVLQISWWDVTKRPRRTIARIIEALEARGVAAA